MHEKKKTKITITLFVIGVVVLGVVGSIMIPLDKLAIFGAIFIVGAFFIRLAVAFIIGLKNRTKT